MNFKVSCIQVPIIPFGKSIILHFKMKEGRKTKEMIIKRFAGDKKIITIFNQVVGFPITISSSDFSFARSFSSTFPFRWLGYFI